MAKPILYYTLKRDWWYSTGMVIMAVTSETKPAGVVTQLWGQNTETGISTHCPPKQTVGRFMTLERAQDMVKRVKRVRERHAEVIQIMNAASILAQRAERDAIEMVLEGQGEPIPPMPYELLRKAAGTSPDRRKLLGVM